MRRSRVNAAGRDRLSRFIRAGAWAAIVSGLAVAISLLLEWLVVPYERLGAEAYLTGWYLLSAGLRLLSGVLLVWAVIGLYERQSRVAGTFGLWAFVVAFFGSVLQACESWGETFVWPTNPHRQCPQVGATSCSTLPVE
jgi:hypothetical protein